MLAGLRRVAFDGRVGAWKLSVLSVGQAQIQVEPVLVGLDWRELLGPSSRVSRRA